VELSDAPCGGGFWTGAPPKLERAATTAPAASSLPHMSEPVSGDPRMIYLVVLSTSP
jgi:hypothetical protein